MDIIHAIQLSMWISGEMKSIVKVIQQKRCLKMVVPNWICNEMGIGKGTPLSVTIKKNCMIVKRIGDYKGGGDNVAKNTNKRNLRT